MAYNISVGTYCKEFRAQDSMLPRLLCNAAQNLLAGRSLLHALISIDLRGAHSIGTGGK